MHLFSYHHGEFHLYHITYLVLVFWIGCLFAGRS